MLAGPISAHFCTDLVPPTLRDRSQSRIQQEVEGLVHIESGCCPNDPNEQMLLENMVVNEHGGIGNMKLQWIPMVGSRMV